MDGGKNNLKNDVADGSSKKSIRPGFLGGGGGGDTPIGLNTDNPGIGKEDAASLAEKNLSDAEKAASGGLYNRGDNLDGARAAEKGGFYSGAATAAAKIATKGKFKGSFKKGGPLVGIIFVIFGVGALMGGTQFFQPFSLIAQFQETSNSMEKSANARSTRWARWQLGDYVKDPVKGSKIFGNEHFKISDKQVEELKRQGIEVNEDRTEMRYVTATGEERSVTAGDFRNTYDTDTEFFHKYNAGSMTWRGQFANWFGTNTNNFLKNNKITRNLFNDYKKQKEANGGDGLKVVRDKLENRTKSISDGGLRVAQKEEYEVEKPAYNEDGSPKLDENGNQVMETRTEIDVERGSASSGSISRGDADAVHTKLSDISAKFDGAANAACAASGVLGAINLMVAANEALQIINTTPAYFEAINKTQAGYGDDAPINELMGTLNEKKVNEYELVDGAGSGTETVKTEKTPMQAAGVGALYGGGWVDPNDASVRSLNFTSSVSRVLGGVGVSMEEFQGCMTAKQVTALASAAISAVEIAGCVLGMLGAPFTFGMSTAACGSLATSIVGGIVLAAELGLAIDAVISIVSPAVVDMMTRDLPIDQGGEFLGNALASGGNMYLGSTHRANGGSLATADKYEEYAVVQQQILAEKAKEERLSLSPFDVTSKNTFMGSIMTQLMSFNTTSSLMSVVTTGGSVMSASLVGLTSPAATAYDIARYLPGDDYEETCPYLASIGAVGDAYCNPYIMTDVSTMDDDPGTVIDVVDGYGGFSGESGDGNVTIDKNSDLAKYIKYCDNRTSAFGLADQAIVGEVSSIGEVQTGNSGLDAALNGAIGSIPVFGDVLEIAQDQGALDNIGYVSGESCVAGNNVDAAASPNWEKSKYYQRFIEDQSLAESTGLITKSAVAVFLEEYYKENPLDNSYEGMLARYSGLDKDTVTDLLDIVAYYDYLAQYDANERYAFDGVSEDEEMIYLFDEENILDGDVVIPENIVYADVRNRTFVV